MKPQTIYISWMDDELKKFYKKCRHGALKLFCVRCNYMRTGIRKSTLNAPEVDIVEFMNKSINKRLKELY